MTPVEFRGDLWLQKTRVRGLSCGVVCVILRLAVLVEHRLVTDRQTDGQTGPWLVPYRAVKKLLPCILFQKDINMLASEMARGTGTVPVVSAHFRSVLPVCMA